MFDFNCDVAQEYGVYKNVHELEIAKYMSSINIAAGFHSGDPMSIKRVIEFAREREIAIGAHIGYPDIPGFGYRKMHISDEEIEALVIYQIGAIDAFARAYGLEIEHVRCHGAMYIELSENLEFAKSVARAVHKFNPWLTLIIGNYAAKKAIEEEVGIKCAYEVVFTEASSIRELREMEHTPETVHFTTVDDAKRAYEVIKPTPIGYNRVKAEL